MGKSCAMSKILNNFLNGSIHVFKMRDEKEERKKQARSNKQTRQSNTAHPKERKNEHVRMYLNANIIIYSIINYFW